MVVKKTAKKKISIKNIPSLVVKNLDLNKLKVSPSNVIDNAKPDIRIFCSASQPQGFSLMIIS